MSDKPPFIFPLTSRPMTPEERAAYRRAMSKLFVPDTRIRELEAEVTRLREERHYAEVTPASAVAPEVAVLRENQAALAAKVLQTEAEAAAIREALEETVGMHENCDPDECHAAEPSEKVCAALASDAGRDLLERLARVEKDHANDLADLHMVARHCSEIYEYASGGIVTKPNTLPSEVIALSQERESRDAQEAAAQALEEAARVADGRDHGDCHDPGCNCDGGELAAAIRALKEP